MALQRRQFLRAAGAAAATAPAIAAPALAQTPAKLTWRLTSSFPKSLDIVYATAQQFAKHVSDATDGAFLIKPYPAGEIATSPQALETVTSGAAECAHSPASYFAAKEPTLALGSGTPFGLNQRQQQAWWAAGGSVLFNEGLKRFNAMGLVMGSAGALGGGWFVKEITSPEDFRGLRIRTTAVCSNVLTRLGALPQQVTTGEIAAALASGTLDAATYMGPHDDEKLGLGQPGRFYHTPGWWDRASTLHLLINLDAWSKLPKSYQAIVTQAAEAANSWMLSQYDALNAPALKRLVAAGAVLKPFPTPVLEACQKATAEYYAELAAQNPLFKKALDSILLFRSEQSQWWQVSDFALDSFMAARRDKG